MKPKIRYFLNSAYEQVRGRGFACPSCGSLQSRLICRKKWVTGLRRCVDCKLLFRAPTTSEKDSNTFYQNEYDAGFTTSLPNPSELKAYLADCFRGTPKDFRRYINLLESLGIKQGFKLLDFGCSWGYGSWQFAEHGFDVTGFEVSRPRMDYARDNLGVAATSDPSEIVGSFDVIFSAHVLEHVPLPRSTIDFALTRLKEGGLLVIITPNGSIERRLNDERGWMRAWGLKHPNLLDELFYQENFKKGPLLLTSKLADSAMLASWTKLPERRTGPLDGSELLAVIKKQQLN